MTLDELIDRLQEIRDEHGDVEVRGVFQPNYPLLADISAVTTIIEDGEIEVFIGLADGREYGDSRHYEDDEVNRDDEEDEEDE